MSNIQLPDPFNRIEPAHKKQKKINTGEALFLQGSTTRGLFYLHSGAIELTRETSSGHSIVIHRAYEGAMFAEASLFTNLYHCTAIATKDTAVIECRRDIILNLLQNNLEFTRAVVLRFATHIQESRRHIELLSIRSADERVLSAINSGLLVDDISKLANLLGLAQETVYRALKRLVGKGQIIKNARGKYQPITSDN
ncbi:MAG: Crp/Fnr family transcriptional regulator [Granulosicoccaceae bacterium]